jgi:hypothetical protein
VYAQQTTNTPPLLISEDGGEYFRARKIIFDGATITDNEDGSFTVSFGEVTASFLLLEGGTDFLLQGDGTSKIIL